MASVDLDNIQFYFSPPSSPGYRLSRPNMAHSSAGILMLNSSDCTELSTAAVSITTPSPEQPHPLENLHHLPPFHPAQAAWAPTTSSLLQQKQQESTSPWVVSKNFSQVLEAFGIAEIKTVDLTSDDSTSQASLPSMSLSNLECNFDDKSSYIPQSPNSNSMVSTRLASPAGLLDMTLDKPHSSSQREHFHASKSYTTEPLFPHSGAGDPVKVGSSCNIDTADTQLYGLPDVSVPSLSQPDTEAVAASTIDSPAHISQKQPPTSPQLPRYPRVEVVIPTGFHTRNLPTLDITDNHGPTSVYDCKCHGSADAEHESSAPPAKQQRVSLQPSMCYNYSQSTVSAANPPTQIQQQATTENAHAHDNNTEEKGSEEAGTGFVQTAHEESGREPGQAGHTCLCQAGHAPLPPEEAMTLASAVVLELYSLLSPSLRSYSEVILDAARLMICWIDHNASSIAQDPQRLVVFIKDFVIILFGLDRESATKYLTEIYDSSPAASEAGDEDAMMVEEPSAPPSRRAGNSKRHVLLVFKLLRRFATPLTSHFMQQDEATGRKRK
ncbi:hypothetical protein DIZ76_014817 [Coccidioides immitis]|nr:hypothetical protein DIZ76_014817 [Coccidioides immitis]